MGIAVPAVGTDTAAAAGGDNHFISLAEIFNERAGFHYYSGRFMSDDAGKFHIAPDAFYRLVIRCAESAGTDADKDFIIFGFGSGYFFKYKIVEIFQYGGKHFFPLFPVILFRN